MKSPATGLIQSEFLGTLSYAEGLTAQSRALASLSTEAGSAAILLGLEHHPVATLGVRGTLESDLQVSADDLRRNGLELHETPRGGQATIHSPGQLVVYPCVNLRVLDIGPRDFVRLIERVTKTWLQTLGIECETGPQEPGLFVDGAKLVAFGFKISRGLTSHGLAINVSNDLSLFDLIRTCGVSGQRVTKLRNYGISTDLEALFLSWSHVFGQELVVVSDPLLTEAPSGR